MSTITQKSVFKRYNLKLPSSRHDISHEATSKVALSNTDFLLKCGNYHVDNTNNNLGVKNTFE